MPAGVPVGVPAMPFARATAPSSVRHWLHETLLQRGFRVQVRLGSPVPGGTPLGEQCTAGDEGSEKARETGRERVSPLFLWPATPSPGFFCLQGSGVLLRVLFGQAPPILSQPRPSGQTCYQRGQACAGEQDGKQAIWLGNVPQTSVAAWGSAVPMPPG